MRWYGVEWFFVAANVPESEGRVVGAREKVVGVARTPINAHHPPSVGGQLGMD